jgi:hypothetical protein
MITNIKEFKQYINESMGDISHEEIEIKRFKKTFVQTLNNTFTKESVTSTDWAGIHAWNISGDLSDGYFIVESDSTTTWEISYDLIRRYDDEDDNVQQDVIASLDTYKSNEVTNFIDIAKSYISVDMNEDYAFDTVANIGKITKTITIELDLKHSMHSMERQGRSSEYIKNGDIKQTVDNATEQIIDLLIDNTLNINDPVLIHNSTNDLNVVGSLLSNKKTDVITFKVITCMFHKNFYNKNNTYKITV